MRVALRNHVSQTLNGFQGFVAWDACPMRNIPQWRHDLSFMQAVYLAMGFTQTECKNEWLVVRRDLLPLIRSRTRFKECTTIIDCDLARIGRIGNIEVFLELKWPDGFHYQFMCGSNIGVALGQVLNSPHIHQPPVVDPPAQ